MTPKIKELTKEIDRLLGGEIMELKFGCEMINKDEPKDWAKLVTLISYDGVKSVGYFREQDGSIFNLKTDFEKFEILGRPINLEDVMRAIDKKYRGDRLATGSSNGWVHFGVDRCLWIMGKPLSQQSDETINSIAEILK